MTDIKPHIKPLMEEIVKTIKLYCRENMIVTTQDVFSLVTLAHLQGLGYQMDIVAKVEGIKEAKSYREKLRERIQAFPLEQRTH